MILQLLFSKSSCFLLFHFLSGNRESADQSSSASNGICFGLALGLFLVGYFSDLIKIALEYSCVRNVFCGFRQLKQNHTGTYLQKAHDDCCYAHGCAFEALE